MTQLENYIASQETQIRSKPGYWQEEFSSLIAGSNVTYSTANELRRMRNKLHDKLEGFKDYHKMTKHMESAPLLTPDLKLRKFYGSSIKKDNAYYS